MGILIAFALAILRLTGFVTEPLLVSDEIHAINGEPARVMGPLADDRPLRIVTWNIERGVRFDRVAATLAELDADVILLQEVDRFCARSDDRDVAHDLAMELRMNYLSAGEFQEIGEGRRGRACVSGQAILSRMPIGDPLTIRFTDQASLKWRLNPAQPRRGGRIALRARIGNALFYSVHLESGGDELRRANQARDILRDVPAGRDPVIVAGDFNNLGDAASPMFAGFRDAGFDTAMTRGAGEGATAARRPIDWIFARNAAAEARIVRATDASDHDPVIAETFVQRRF